MICTNTDHHVNTLPTIKKEKKRKKKKAIKVCHAITPFAYKAFQCVPTGLYPSRFTS